LVIAAVAVLINVYTIHCILNGSCNAFSWFLTIMTVIYSVLAIIMYSGLIAHNEGIIKIT